VDKAALGQVFSEYFGFPCQSTDFSIIIITRGWHNRPLSGRIVEWTLIPHPPMQIKKKYNSCSCRIVLSETKSATMYFSLELTEFCAVSYSWSALMLIYWRYKLNCSHRWQCRYSIHSFIFLLLPLEHRASVKCVSLQFLNLIYSR
jgi:hypothetical protein